MQWQEALLAAWQDGVSPENTSLYVEHIARADPDCSGGCSAINAMIYNKGSPSDYNEWEKLGNPGWSFKDVQPYFQKAEGLSSRAADQLSQEDLAEHGRTGPWKIGYSHLTPLTNNFLDACDSVGIPKTADINSSRGINGVSRMQTFIDDNGQRSSTAVAYLTADVASRPNLKLAVGQTVTKILFDEAGSEPRAVGVEMSAGSATPIRYLAKATREVIVCAGAVHTPHILQLSGIGRASNLAKHSIKVVKDLPGVGANLVDHIFSSIVFETKKGSSLQYLADPLKSLPALAEWLRYGTGAMTTNVAEAAGFCRTIDREDAPEALKNNDLSSGPDSADLEILTGAAAYIDHGRTVPKDKNVSTIIACVLQNLPLTPRPVLHLCRPHHAPPSSPRHHLPRLRLSLRPTPHQSKLS